MGKAKNTREAFSDIIALRYLAVIALFDKFSASLWIEIAPRFDPFSPFPSLPASKALQ
jgi:hypothetical protein